MPLPKIETRRRFLIYHDLRHLVTGYSVGWIGVGEVSAWWLGAGSAFFSPTLGFTNLIALSTGLALVIDPVPEMVDALYVPTPGK